MALEYKVSLNKMKWKVLGIESIFTKTSSRCSLDSAANGQCV